MRALGVLGAVAALLAAYLLFFDHDPRQAGESEQATRLLPAFDRAGLERVTVARAGEPAFSLVRAAGGWRIDPDGAAADQAAVEDLLGALDQARSERTADVSPDAAGLSPARVTLSLGDGSRSTVLRLGRQDATGRGVFVQDAAGGPVRVGPGRLLQLADRPASAFRDRRVVPFAPDAVTRVAWRARPDEREHSVHRQGASWRNASGERVAPERVAEAIRQLIALRADGTAGETGRVQVADQAGATVPLTGGVPEAEWSGLWRVLATADVADRRLLSTPPDRVRRIELDDGARRLILMRESSDRAWRFADDAAHEVDQASVSEWLARLAKTEVRSPARSGRRLVVDGADADAVTLGPTDPAYADLAPDPLRFRSRKVLDFAHFDARQLRRISASGTLEAHSADGETWSSTPQADSAGVGRVASALGNLQAAAWLPRAPAGRPELVLEISVQAPGDPVPVRHTLKLWPDCEAEMENAGAFRVAQDRCADLRLDPASALKR